MKTSAVCPLLKQTLGLNLNSSFQLCGCYDSNTWIGLNMYMRYTKRGLEPGCLQTCKQEAQMLPVSSCQRWPFLSTTWNQCRGRDPPVNTDSLTSAHIHLLETVSHHSCTTVAFKISSPQAFFNHPPLTWQQPALIHHPLEILALVIFQETSVNAQRHVHIQTPHTQRGSMQIPAVCVCVDIMYLISPPGTAWLSCCRPALPWWGWGRGRPGPPCCSHFLRMSWRHKEKIMHSGYKDRMKPNTFGYSIHKSFYWCCICSLTVSASKLIYLISQILNKWLSTINIFS